MQWVALYVRLSFNWSVHLVRKVASATRKHFSKQGFRQGKNTQILIENMLFNVTLHYSSTNQPELNIYKKTLRFITSTMKRGLEKITDALQNTAEILKFMSMFPPTTIQF